VVAATPRLRAIAAAIGGPWHPTGRGVMVRCPAHDDRDPSLHLGEAADGRLLVRCFAGCSQGDVIAALEARGLWPGRSERLPARRAALRPAEPDAAWRLDAARRIWGAAGPATGTIVEAYLCARGLTRPPPASLRYAPALLHRSGRRPPAMVAAVQGPDGRLVGVQRTWLRPDGAGKADVDPPRMALGAIAGGAVRLGPAAAEIAVAEGIETGLAVAQATGLPVWAALSTGGLRSLILPPEVRTVLVFSDGDAPGEAAARAAASRWLREGCRVRIARPPSGMDANDLLRAGPHEIP
jgi:putative DNA primase/helicase